VESFNGKFRDSLSIGGVCNRKPKEPHMKPHLACLLGSLLVMGVAGCEKVTPQTEDAVLPPFKVQAHQGGATCSLQGMTAPTRIVVIPETIEGMTVTQIDNFSSLLNSDKGSRGWSYTHSGTGFSFGGGGSRMAPTNDITEHIVIPGSVQRITGGAFRYCKKLKKVTFSEGLITIGKAAFEHCAKLESVEFPSSLREIEGSAFNECRALHTVVFQDGFEQLGSAFARCGALTEITFPKSFKSLESNAFYHCGGLKRVIFLGDKPSGGIVGNRTPSVVYYDPHTKGWDQRGGPMGRKLLGTVFSRRTILEIPIKGTVFDFAFKNGGAVICRWNEPGAAVIPETVYGVPVTVIAAYAFQGHEMTELSLPDTIREIHLRAFEGCANLVKVQLSAELEFLGGYAFENCPGITELELPPQLSYLGRRALSGTGIESLVLPASVKSVGKSAFASNKHLKSVVFLGDLPQCSEEGHGQAMFWGSSSDVTVYYLPGRQGWDGHVYHFHDSLRVRMIRTANLDTFFGRRTLPYQDLLARTGKSEEAATAYGNWIVTQERLVKEHPGVPEYVNELAALYVNSGILEQGWRRYSKAIAHYERSLERLRSLKKDGQLARYLAGWDKKVEQRLVLCQRAERAIKELSYALAQPPEQAAGLLWIRGSVLAERGNYAGAAESSEKLAALVPPKDQPAAKALNLYNAGCLLSLSSAAAARSKGLPVPKRKELAERYATRALGLLSDARVAGFFKDAERIAHIAKDSALEPLRTRADFKKFLQELQSTPQPQRN
jgi:tetratricopeptide (TPR) repeat protein